MKSLLVLALGLAILGGCSRDNAKPAAHQPVVVSQASADPINVKVGQAVIIERSAEADCVWKVDQLSDSLDMLIAPTDQQSENQKVKFSFSPTRPGQAVIKLGLHKGKGEPITVFELKVNITKDADPKQQA